MTSVRSTRTALGVVCALGLAVLYLPLLVSVLYSFNEGIDGKQTARLTGWSLGAYADAWQDDSLRTAALTGLQVALVVAAVSGLLGSVWGYSMVRHPSTRVRRLLAGLAYLLVIMPEVVLAVSLLQFAGRVGIPLGFLTLAAAHTPVTMVVVALIVRARVLTLDRRLEDAGRDLGASELRILSDIVAPALLPAVLTGTVLAFTFSFDDLVISAFLTTPSVNTLPVYLYSSLNYGTTPAVYAATTAVLALTIVALGAAGLLHRRSARRRRPEPLVLRTDSSIDERQPLPVRRLSA
jgi:ABC-type spermidine/putrescine transport system permease subunit II